MYIYIYIYVYLLGESENTARGYCLDIPRLEESPNNKKHSTKKHSRNKVSDSKNGQTVYYMSSLLLLTLSVIVVF